MATFWTTALDLGEPDTRGTVSRLEGPTPEHTVWVNQVPEPITVKQRVHLDVNVVEVAELERIGARVVDTTHKWTVLADPEGGELCAFPRDGVPAVRLFEIVVDSVDPERQARWWAAAFGAEVGHDDAHPWWWVQDIPAAPMGLVFVPVPEPKVVKNRIHWDVTVEAVEPVIAAGATLLRARGAGTDWDVLADPEGNEFCAFTVPG
jgi:hypothetical protein